MSQVTEAIDRIGDYLQAYAPSEDDLILDSDGVRPLLLHELRAIYLAMSSASPPVEQSEGVQAERLQQIIRQNTERDAYAHELTSGELLAIIAALKEGHSLSTVSGVVNDD